MAAAKKQAAARTARTRSAKAPAKKTVAEASSFTTFLVIAFTGLSIVFAIVAYTYYK